MIDFPYQVFVDIEKQIGVQIVRPALICDTKRSGHLRHTRVRNPLAEHRIERYYSLTSFRAPRESIKTGVTTYKKGYPVFPE